MRRLALIGVVVLSAGCAAPAPAGHPLSQPERRAFWAGLNYPWKTGQDFGTGGWGHSGVSDSTIYREVDADFANMAAQGVRVVKWRIFNDGRYGLQFADDGSVVGLDEFFFPDIDAALDIAKRHDVYLVFTLFSSGFWTADCRDGTVQLGGHAHTLLDPSARRSLLDNAVVPLLAHIGSNDRVLAYEVIAEPEWGIQELHLEQDQRIKLPLDVLRSFVQDVTGAIHRYTRAKATVESNRFSNMHAWRGLGLDYYSFSWYDWLEPYEPLATPASAANLDRPIVLGEYPAGGSVYFDVGQVLESAHSLGYAGAFGWSYWAGDGISRWREVAPTFSAWAAENWQAISLGRGSSAPSPGPIRERQYPYTYQDLTLQLDGTWLVATLRINVPSGEAYVPRAYLYRIGNPQPLEEVRLTAAAGRPGALAARFTRAAEGVHYAISLGIFDPGGPLRKWFNNIATLAIDGSRITTPQVDTLALELGCAA